MQKTKQLFERISLEEVRQIIRSGKNRERDSTPGSETLDEALPLTQGDSVTTRRTPKRQPVRARDSSPEGDEYPLGVWMDKSMFYRHQGRQHRIVLHDPQPTTNNRYLTLADLALNNHKQRTSHNGKNDMKNEARAR
jgi:hypothetical protein